MERKLVSLLLCTLLISVAFSTAMSFKVSGSIVTCKNSQVKSDISTLGPDCDGRLWLWGPYGGWVGGTINFTSHIGSLTREDAWRLGECCVDFLWEFGDGDTLNFTCCTMEEYEQQKPNYVSHVYENIGSYTAKITVTSPFLELYDTDDVIIKDTNPNPPAKPIVEYKRVYNVGCYVHQYSIIGIDDDMDPVRFYFEFEDGYVPWHPIPTQHGWTKFYHIGEKAIIWHSTEITNGKCRVKAQDICGAESDWVVVKSKNKQQFTFPFLFQMSQKLLNI